jgi:hypothetical protein
MFSYFSKFDINNNPHAQRIKDTLTIMCALLPLEYADELKEFSKIDQFFETYKAK